MIYIGLLRIFWPVLVLLGCAAIAARLLRLKAAGRILKCGLIGSFAGYLLTPVIGASVGVVPPVMIEPWYLVHPFIGCIAPGPLGLACMFSAAGVVLGFLAGGCIYFRRRNHA